MTSQENDGGFTIVGEKNVRRAMHMSLAHAVALEINTGLKTARYGSAVKACNRISGGTGRTKVKALQDLLTFMYEDQGYRVRANGGVHRASGWMTISLHISEAYQVGGRQSLDRQGFVKTVEDAVIPPPPRGEDAAHEWALTWIFGFTGQGGEWSNVTSWHDVTVTACSEPDLVGAKFEFGY